MGPGINRKINSRVVVLYVEEKSRIIIKLFSAVYRMEIFYPVNHGIFLYPGSLF